MGGQSDSKEHKLAEKKLLEELEVVMNAHYEESLHYTFIMFLNNCFSVYSMSIDSMGLEGFLRFCEDYQVLQATHPKHISTHITASMFDHQADSKGNVNLAGFRKLVRKISEVFYANDRNSVGVSSQKKFEMFCEQLQRFQVQSSPAMRVHADVNNYWSRRQTGAHVEMRYFSRNFSVR